jgi:DNA-binding NarL/FixJ family response regulator
MDASTDKPHILVVDDDTRLRELLKSFLSRNDFRVSTAASAAEARQRLSSLDFDLLVLDVMMPGETGLELREVRAAKDRRRADPDADRHGRDQGSHRRAREGSTTISPSPSSRASCCCASRACCAGADRPARSPHPKRSGR